MNKNQGAKAFFIASLGLGIIAAGSYALAQTPATFKSIAIHKVDGKLEFMAVIEGSFSPEFALLNQPSRLLVDLAGVERITASPYTQIDDMGILDVRTGQFKPQTARIVFDLGSPAPKYSYTVEPTGLKILFWLSGDEAPVRPVRKPADKPARPAVREATPRQAYEATGTNEKIPTGFFAQIKGGTAIFLQSDQAAVTRQFTLYGETATIDEVYSWKPGPAFDVALGTYLRALGTTVKAGLGFTYQMPGASGILSLSVPHPFETNSPRLASAEKTDGLDSKFQSIYAFGLFSLVRGGALSVWAGPMIGVTMGTLVVIADYDLEDQISTISVSGLTTIEEKITEPMFGALLSLEYRFNDRMALVFDAKAVYFNPMSANMGKRVNFLQLQPMLGIQFQF